MKEKAYKLAKFLIGWPLSAVALYFIWQIIAPHSQNLISSLNNLKPFLLTTGILCFVSYYHLRGFIWYRLLNDNGHKIPLKHASYLWAISELKRYIPGNIWSILGRTMLFEEWGVNKKDTGILLIIETQIFLLSCAILALLSMPFLFTYFLPSLPFSALFASIITTIILAISLAYIYNRQLYKKMPQRIKQITQPLLPKNPPKDISFIIFISLISLVFFGLGYYFTISSIIFLHPQLLPQLIGLFSLTLLLGFLSFLTPAGLGIREGTLTFALSKIGDLSITAFASLFARIILIISELVFIGISLTWLKLKNQNFSRLEAWVASHQQESILFSLFLLYVAYFTITSFMRYDNFYTGRFDLGNMAQTIWNTSQGRIFVMTNPNGTDIISRLGFHADFILILLTPFYWLWPNPKTLLLVQTIIVASGAFFVFLIAKKILNDKNLALTFSFLYLINPSIERANLYDFHGVTLATFFLLGASYFYLKKRYIYFSLFALLASITKEEIWLITALFGIFIFGLNKKRLLGASILFISLTIFIYLVWHAIPQALGSQHFALSYYSEFGDSPSEIIKTVLLNPQQIVGTILEQGRIDYLKQIFLPLGFLSLLSPLFLILATPDLLINLLSNNSQLHQIYYQYTSAINPFIFLAAIMSVSFIKKRNNSTNIILIIYLLTVSIISAYLFGPLPGALDSNLDMYTRIPKNREFIDNYISQIPENSSVAATNNLGSHLSQRQKIYTVPLGIESADFVIFLLTEPKSTASEKILVQKLKKNNKYILNLEKNEFVVFIRKAI